MTRKGLFTVSRSDRTRGRGDGVCVFVSDCLPVIAIRSNLLSDFIADTNTVVSDDRVHRTDIVCIEHVSLFRVIAVYRPPSNDTAPPALTYQLNDAARSLVSQTLPTVIVDDFNCPDID